MKKIIPVFILACWLSLGIPPTHAQTIEWRLAESWPQDFPIFGDAVKRMTQLVEEFSNGRLLIKSVPREVHNQPLGILDLVQAGSIKWGIRPPITGKIPISICYSLLPCH